MEKKNTTHMISGQILPLSEGKSSLSADEIKNALSDLTKPFDDYERGEEPAKKARKKPVSEITPKNLGKLESIDIKGVWEKIGGPSRTKGSKYSVEDGKVSTSDSDIPLGSNSVIGMHEISEGGRDMLPPGVNSIFDPNAMENVKTDEFSQHAIDAGKQKRKDREDRKKRPRDWEVEERAKTTADVDPMYMGFTPTRSAFSQQPIPEVKVKEIENIKEQSEKNRQQGIEAAALKTEIDKIFNAQYEKEISDTRRWEEIEAEKIQDTVNKKHGGGKSSVEVAPDFTSLPKKSEGNLDLTGIFKIPENPENYRDADGHLRDRDVKRSSDDIKAQRKTRQDDRSWETLSNSKSKKMR